MLLLTDEMYIVNTDSSMRSGDFSVTLDETVQDVTFDVMACYDVRIQLWRLDNDEEYEVRLGAGNNEKAE